MKPSDIGSFTAEYLRGIILYDPSTGYFWWPLRDGNKNPDAPAGTIRKDNRREIMIGNRGYLTARLAWLYMTGEWPLIIVDHKDRNSLNDKWNNLRLATDSQSSMNRSIRLDNTSGIKGVSYRPNRKKKWEVRISIDKKQKYLYFETKEEAIKVRENLARQYYGEFNSQ